MCLSFPHLSGSRPVVSAALLLTFACLSTRSGTAAPAPAPAPVPPPAVPSTSAAKPPGPARWENEVSRIEARLKAHPPAPGGIVFAGSSSIRLWNLAESFPGLPVTNCGFGGSTIPDSTHFASRLVIPLKPRLVVFYAGDNDSSSGRSARRIADDFRDFADTVHTNLPDCRVLFIPIKPSIARRKLLPLQREANSLIQSHCATRPDWLLYLDLATPLLGPDGALQPALYKKDGLHLSPEGYRIWARLLRPVLEETVRKPEK